MSEEEEGNICDDEHHIRVGLTEDEGEDPTLVECDPEDRFHRSNEQIAEGRFKTVYRGYDIQNGIDVAWCKVRGETIEILNTIYSEMCKGLELDHPNIIRCYRCWIDTKTQCINLITELFTSGTLREYREHYSNVDMNVHKKHLRQILNGVEYLHSRKPAVVHADIRLDKIYVNGFNGEVKLGDLGLNTLLTQRYHPSNPPHEFDSPLADLFAVGSCGYELIAGVKLDRMDLARCVKEIKNLGKITNQEARDFILKCFSMEEDLTAHNLLEHPFLKSKGTGVKLKNGQDWEESKFDAQKKGVGTKLRGEDWSFEFRGYRSEEEPSKVFIRLVMSSEAGSEHKTTLDFEYNLETDTPESVGGDIADSFALSITDRELCKAALGEWLSVMSQQKIGEQGSTSTDHHHNQQMIAQEDPQQEVTTHNTQE